MAGKGQTAESRAPTGDTRIIADIGGTKARFALVDVAGKMGAAQVLRCGDCGYVQYIDPGHVPAFCLCCGQLLSRT